MFLGLVWPLASLAHPTERQVSIRSTPSSTRSPSPFGGPASPSLILTKNPWQPKKLKIIYPYEERKPRKIYWVERPVQRQSWSCLAGPPFWRLGLPPRDKREAVPTGPKLGVSQMTKLIPGKLYKLQYFNRRNEPLNDKLVLYLGEDHIHREDGEVIENILIQVVGEDRILKFRSAHLRRYLKDID